MEGVRIRDAGSGDAEGLSELWIEFGRDYEDIDPVQFRTPELVVTGGERRKGIGKALMDAVERWARERGATVSFVVSYAHSPTSIPFHKEGMGYARKTVGFWKRLGGA
jgi:GNAT superfamily N-acetyltransferase